MTPSQARQSPQHELRKASYLTQPPQSVCYHSGDLVASATTVVKRSVVTLSAAREIVSTTTMAANDWKTFRGRVDWVLAQKPELGNQSTWALRSGKPSSISSALSREKKKPGFRIEVDTAEELARVAGVDPAWLRTGQGMPDGTARAHAQYDTHEMRKWAAEMLTKLDGVEPIVAWWVMRDIELPEPTREDFLTVAHQRLKEAGHKPPELTEAKVKTFTAEFQRSLDREP
jgi:hypothetical protein